jgi:hypothetical protein
MERHRFGTGSRRPAVDHLGFHLWSPETWALITAITDCLRGVPLWQPIAAVWLFLMDSVAEPQGSRLSIKQLRGTECLAKRSDGLLNHYPREWAYYLGLGIRLGNRLRRLARELEKSSEDIAPQRLLELLSAPLPKWSRQRAHAVRTLAKHATGPAPDLPFHIIDATDTRLDAIHLTAFPEVISGDGGWRVRPHRFSFTTDCFLGRSILQVAQVVEDETGVRWDTLSQDNESFPFWPKARDEWVADRDHRCAVHQVRGKLEWTDHPAIRLGRSQCSHSPWHFATGVFLEEAIAEKRVLRLLARLRWSVSWDDSS